MQMRYYRNRQFQSGSRFSSDSGDAVSAYTVNIGILRKTAKKAAARCMSALLAAGVLAGAMLPVRTAASGAVTTQEVREYETEHSQIAMDIARESVVLLENRNNVLPIAKEGRIAIYGKGSVQTIKGGSGSGEVNNRIVYPDGTSYGSVGGCSTIYGAFLTADYEIVNSAYINTIRAELPNRMVWAPEPEELLDPETVAADAAAADTAIYTIRRNAGEGRDRRPVEGDWYLSQEEQANIDLLTKTFKKTIVLLNVTSIDSSWIEESGVDAVVLIGVPGQMAGAAVLDNLNGTVTPSGKLVDTWAKDIDDYPSTELFSNINVDDYWKSRIEYYNEDIYVGYRYFDTFAPDRVNYPFGYGKSYTSFSIETENVTADEENVTVTAKVTNTGDTYSGKEVVQVYFSAPAGALDKPWQELAAYGKTDTLAPGESQTLTMSFRTQDMSSYSEKKAAYIMEAGDYVIRVGSSSRDTVPAAVIELDRTLITQQLANQMSPDREGKTPGGGTGRGDPPYGMRFETTVEKNTEKYQLRRDAFREIAAEGSSYQEQADTSGIIRLTIAENLLENSENSIYANGSGEDVNVYVSAGTDQKLLGIRGYNYENDKAYHVTPVYFGADGKAALTQPEQLADYSEATLLDVYEGRISMEQLVSGMSVEELADMVEGGNKSSRQKGQVFGGESPSEKNISLAADLAIQKKYVKGSVGETNGLYIKSRLIPNIIMTDGPAGVRITQSYEKSGTTYYQFATAFPSGQNLAQTWNLDMVATMGKAVGREMEIFNIDVWLAPAMNIHRNPLCGRNFEYYSEDPLITGLTASAQINGVQSVPGRGVTIKHFAANNQEVIASESNSVVSERALREIYLKGFEIAVRTAQPLCVMSAYNNINNIPTSNDYELLENILRKEWGFDGMVMTDWGGSGGYSDARAMHAGNDLIMSGNTSYNILGYISDAGPCIEFENRIAIDGGYPYRVVKTGLDASGTGVRVTTMWGDYEPDGYGSAYEVRTTKELFETKTRPVVVYTTKSGKSLKRTATTDPFVIENWTIKEIFDGKDYPDGTHLAGFAAQNAASYRQEGEYIWITYMLSKISDYDNISTMQAADPANDGYQKPWSTDILGNPDVNTLTLGDLQKSVCHILRAVMATSRFAELIGEQPVPYCEAKSDKLTTVLNVTKGKIQK